MEYYIFHSIDENIPKSQLIFKYTKMLFYKYSKKITFWYKS